MHLSLLQFTAVNSFQAIAKHKVIQEWLYCYAFCFLVPYSVHIPVSPYQKMMSTRSAGFAGIIQLGQSSTLRALCWQQVHMHQVENMLLQVNFFNNYPVYTGPNGSTYWKIYVRSEGPAAGKWVLNGNVHEDWHGTVAYMDSLFSPLI